LWTNKLFKTVSMVLTNFWDLRPTMEAFSEIKLVKTILWEFISVGEKSFNKCSIYDRSKYIFGSIFC